MDITVTITIPEGEYTQWDDFEEGGIDLIKKTLRGDIRYELDRLGIDGDIEIKTD